jgi:hypothetical protein
MISREAANVIYGDTWCRDFVDLEDLSVRIDTMSKAGNYDLYLRFDSLSQLDSVRALLVGLKYDVELYNGYPDILEISWG